ncbi:MAG: DUF6159 family protein [Minisyncoccota bacterium]
MSTSVTPLTVGKFKASWMIVTQSWNILKKDEEILWFPVLSGITSIVALVIFGAVLFFVTLGGTLSNIDSLGSTGVSAFSYVVLFFYYLVMFFIANFFTAGIYTIVNGRFNGQDLTFSDGMNGAKENIGKIFWWSAISATVGIILKIIEDQSRLIGKIVAALLGAAWGILTYFSLPALIIGKTSVKDSFKQSAAVIRKTWGETIIINLGVALAAMSLVFLGAAITLGVIMLAPTSMVMLGMGILFFIFMIALAIMAAAFDAIFKLAIYEYAMTGRVPEGFSPELIQNAVRAK